MQATYMNYDVFVDFGKYQRRHIKQLDAGYLQWVVKTLMAIGSMEKMKQQKVIDNVNHLLKELKACSLKRDLRWGRRIHKQAVATQIDSNIYLMTALIKMYSKCGSMVDAHRVFDLIQKPDVVAWTALLLGYADNGDGHAALATFSIMKAAPGCEPDSVAYNGALKACTSLAVNGDKDDCLKRGREIHLEIGHHLEQYVQNTLINMYGKCGSMADARRLFDSVRRPDTVSWTSLLMGYVENGEGDVALRMFSLMKAAGECSPNSVTYVVVIRACTSLVGINGKGDCLKLGREIHSEIGQHLNHYVQRTLIEMYCKCGSMTDARQVFENIQDPSVECWTSLLQGYVENGDACIALDLFSMMKATAGCVPDSLTYVVALKACTSLAVIGRKSECLKRGIEIHSQIGHQLDPYVLNTVIDMYAKCGKMAEARRVFDSIQNPDVVSWNALIMGYAENGGGLAALDMFSIMKDAGGCAADSVTYIAAIKACASLAMNGNRKVKGDCLKRGREIHSEIGRQFDHSVQSTLIDMYGKCGGMVDAHRVFNSMQKNYVVAWNALIMGYAGNGDVHKALDLFCMMKSTRGCLPNSVTYVIVLKACASIGALAIGMKLHSEISEFTTHIVTCLVDFYAKCGSIIKAREVFDSHSKVRDVTTWNALLAGYGKLGAIACVFKLFEAMQDQGFRPDSVTFVCMLSCCSHAGLVGKAREYLESMPVQYGITPIGMHYNCVVDVLGRANQLNEAIAMLKKMPSSPNAVTWMTLLGACCKWENVEIGRCAFDTLVDIDKESASAYVLMAQLYGSRGMWKERDRVLKARFKFGGANNV